MAVPVDVDRFVALLAAGFALVAVLVVVDLALVAVVFFAVDVALVAVDFFAVDVALVAVFALEAVDVDFAAALVLVAVVLVFVVVAFLVVRLAGSART